MKLSKILSEAAFNTKFEKLRWENKNGVFAARGKIDDDEFELTIEPNSYTVLDEEYTYLNVGFSRILETGPTENLISMNKDQSRAFGAIKNGLEGQVKALDSKYDINAIVMLVKSGEEKRLGIYRRMLTSKINGFTDWTGFRLEITMPSGTALVGMKEHLSPEILKALKSKIESYGKHLDR